MNMRCQRCPVPSALLMGLCTSQQTASLMHAVEDARADPIEVVPQSDLVQEEDSSVNVLIVDAMVVLQSTKKTSAMLMLSDLQDAFIKCID